MTCYDKNADGPHQQKKDFYFIFIFNKNIVQFEFYFVQKVKLFSRILMKVTCEWMVPSGGREYNDLIKRELFLPIYRWSRQYTNSND